MGRIIAVYGAIAGVIVVIGMFISITFVADHGAMCWDETVAFLLVLAIAPQNWRWQAAAFVLFRAFDVVKPPPIRQLESRMKGGFGVMFDDLLAAGYTLLVLALARRFVFP